MSASVLGEWILFLTLAAVALGGAAMMLLTMSMYRAGLFLMVSFLSLAGMFFLLEADLLAVIQIMMNVGGMLVMILFMVMLMMDPGGEMMWEMKRKMKLPGPGAFSMSMPRGQPPAAERAVGTEAQQPSTATGAEYTCPMHPEVRSDQPGTCPQCGMDLVPAAQAPATPAPAADYTCPMHPEVHSTGPGKCPKCGMDLVPRATLGASDPSPDPAEGSVERQPLPNDPTEYTCPMHPEVHSGHPGSCPKCGMDLVPVAEAARTTPEAATSYTCPMHPEVVSPEPGTCPKCGMNLVPVEASPAADPPGSERVEPQAAAQEYTCPMHPEVRSDAPGPCPKCGMDLVPVAPEEAVQSHAPPPAEYTCPMHPEVRSDGPGACPKCGMDLVPAAAQSTAAPAGDSAMGSMDGMQHGAEGTHRMDAAAHHKMMVDMAMSTEQLPWALLIGLLTGGALTALVLWTPWPAVARGRVGDATSAVGELLLSRYMMAFEGAAMLILAGIAAGVILGRREGAAPRADRHAADGASPHLTHGDGTMESPSNAQGASGVWTCPMHPEVRSDGPGKCPKCGMDLVPAESLGNPGGSHGG